MALFKRKPAYTTRDPVTGIVTYESWHNCFGEVSRRDGPAIIARDPVTGIVTRESWCRNNQLHRAGGPAAIVRDGKTGIVTIASWYMRDSPIDAVA